MALGKCVDCNKDMSMSAEWCPACGCTERPRTGCVVCDGTATTKYPISKIINIFSTGGWEKIPHFAANALELKIRKFFVCENDMATVPCCICSKERFKEILTRCLLAENPYDG